MVWIDKRALVLNIGIWCHTLLTKKKNFFNRTVRTAFNTDRKFCLSIHPYVRTDGQTKSTKDRFLMSYLFNKSIIKIRLLKRQKRHLTQTTYFVCLSVRTYGCTDKKYKIYASDVIPFQQKKNFENRNIRT